MKKKFPSLQLYLRNVKFRLRTHFVPELRKVRSKNLLKITRLGSEHGWSFNEKQNLESCVLISVGVGQDISFDVEFANRFKAKVYLVDPTPMSVAYFNQIQNHFGEKKKVDYVSGGVQPAESYDLTNISNENMVLISKALWTSTGNIEFYAPKNPEHNSFSITNLQKTSDRILVPCVTFKELLSEIKVSITEIGILKLDIEGAATEVLTNIILAGFRPSQILVEFEEVFVFSLENLKKIRDISRLLIESGYVLIHSDRIANFSYEYFAS